jgi:L,D-transpeptidase ErfK/SrfK
MNTAKFLALTFLLTLAASQSASAEIFLLPPPGDDLIGLEEKTVTHFEDTLPDLARQYGLGYEEILAANPGVDVWLPGKGREVVLPTRHLLPNAPRVGVVINLPEHRLYYFPKAAQGKPEQLITHPISIGQMDWKTPLGVTRIVAKVRHPVWYPTESIRRQHELDGDPLPVAVPPGPQNPLGDYAMRLGIPGGAYLIHGTNKPVAVGMPVTHGCIRMYPEDIESLFPRVPIGTPVTIVNQPVRTGWRGETLYLEVNPPLEGGDPKVDLTQLTRILVAATRDRPAHINWPLAERTLNEARGMPVAVSVPSLLAQ